MQGCSEVSSASNSHVPSPWLEEVQQCLPLVISGPCKLSLGLNVDTSPQTLAKLGFLLECIKGQAITLVAYISAAYIVYSNPLSS